MMDKSQKKQKVESYFLSLKQLKEQNYPNINIKFNLYKNLPYFSYKILEAKYSSTPEIYQQIILNNLIMRKKNHILAYLNEVQLNTNIFRELLKRFYNYEESKERIPKYVSYYQNYLKFFCRPVFGDYIINKKMVKHMEKVAQIFYNENYAEEDELENSEKHEKFNFKVFNKTIREEIDNYDNYTRVDSDAENNKFFEMKNKKNNLENEDIKSKTIDINRKFIYKNNDLDLLEKIYKITPILDNIKIKKYKNNLTKDNIKNTEYDSFQKIIKEMENKKNKKIKESTHKKCNKISYHGSNIIDYFNSLSSILFSKKKKNILHKNNSMNNKFNKKRDKNNYNTNNNKIINNINININHLTIGQKPIEVNNIHNNDKKCKKRNGKIKKNNSMILKDKSFKKYVNCFGNLTSKYFEAKKRNNTFKFLPGNAIIGYNFNKYKKVKNLNFTSNTTNTRNKTNLKSGRASQNNSSCATSFHKYNKKKDNSKNRFGKMTIYTNNSNYIKNMHNILDINNNSKKIKHSNYNSNSSSINFSSNNHNNKNSFYKNTSLSPLVWSLHHKNKISLNKGGSFISYERIRSTSNKSKKHNKIFSSGFYYNIGSKNMANCSHFISPKNTIINNNISKLKISKNERSHDNNNKNICSPLYRENIPVINKYKSILNKKKLKDEQIFPYSKAINLKFKNFAKLSNLKRNLKIIPKKSRNKSRSKGSNNNRKK